MKTNKIISIGLALFINAGIIAGCSTTPGTVNNPNSNSSSNANVNAGVSNNTSAPNMQDQLAINSEVQADLSDDEMTIEDSDIVANQDSSFSTKAANNKLSANTKLEVNLNKVLGRNQREKLLDDSEKVLKAKIKLNEAKLKVLKAYTKTENLKRKNLKVENSDTVEVANSDGTISKIKTIKFENTNNEKMTRENKVVKTYSSNGTLIKVEYYLTVDGPNFDRTYTKIVNYNSDGSKQVIVKSQSTWENGRSRIVNKERNIDANGNGTGSGTIVITEKDGTTRSYDFNVTITGEIIPVPTPSPSVSPSAQPTMSPQPTASPTVAPTQEPSPTPTATATTSVEVNSSTQINI